MPVAAAAKHDREKIPQDVTLKASSWAFSHHQTDGVCAHKLVRPSLTDTLKELMSLLLQTSDQPIRGEQALGLYLSSLYCE